jgi:hypothetical protein
MNDDDLNMTTEEKTARQVQRRKKRPEQAGIQEIMKNRAVKWYVTTM